MGKLAVGAGVLAVAGTLAVGDYLSGGVSRRFAASLSSSSSPQDSFASPEAVYGASMKAIKAGDMKLLRRFVPRSLAAFLIGKTFTGNDMATEGPDFYTKFCCFYLVADALNGSAVQLYDDGDRFMKAVKFYDVIMGLDRRINKKSRTTEGYLDGEIRRLLEENDDYLSRYDLNIDLETAWRIASEIIKEKKPLSKLVSEHPAIFGFTQEQASRFSRYSRLVEAYGLSKARPGNSFGTITPLHPEKILSSERQLFDRTNQVMGFCRLLRTGDSFLSNLWSLSPPDKSDILRMIELDGLLPPDYMRKVLSPFISPANYATSSKVLRRAGRGKVADEMAKHLEEIDKKFSDMFEQSVEPIVEVDTLVVEETLAPIDRSPYPSGVVKSDLVYGRRRGGWEQISARLPHED